MCFLFFQINKKYKSDIKEYEKMYYESRKCQQNLINFNTIVQQDLDKYKKNPDPERLDIRYKKYVIYLYN